MSVYDKSIYSSIIPSIVAGTINGIVISALALDVIICKKPAISLHIA